MKKAVLGIRAALRSQDGGLTCLKNSVVKAPPSMAMSPSILFWLAFFRMFSSTVLAQTSLREGDSVAVDKTIIAQGKRLHM